MTNPYLVRRRADYDALRQGIEAVQNRAATDGRELTEAELTSVRAQGEQAQALAAEITDLHGIEQRHSAVAGLAADLGAEQRTPGAEQRNSTALGGVTARDRDPGHYQRNGEHSFFGDMFAARSLNDETATRRLVEHNRALAMGGAGLGVIPPVWMANEFAEVARQQRRVAAAVRNIPLASAAPMSMPRQTTTTAVGLQTTEGLPAGIPSADLWATAVDVVAPKAVSGIQKVSRQLLDSGNPAVDALIFGDLIGEYNEQVETLVVAAMLASAGAATSTYLTEAAYTTGLNPGGATYIGDRILDAAIAVRNLRKLPADILVSGVVRYGSFLKIKDSTGRPLVPPDSGGPMNVIGTGEVAVDGRLNGLGVLASDGITSYPENILVARAADTILFESPALRFRYEEPEGPEVIRLGVWAYVATYVKHAGRSVRRIEITGA